MLNHLEVFIQVAKEGSFSKAARKLHLTQPGVSSQISWLEENLGVPLFRRHRSGVDLTDGGQIVLNHALRMLDVQDSLVKSIETYLKEEANTLVVGATHAIGSYGLPCSIWTFKQKYPDVAIQLQVANTAEVVRLVQQNIVDLGVIEGPAELGNLEYRTVSEDRLVVAVPSGHRLAGKDRIELQELTAEPIVLREAGSGVREMFNEACSEAGLTADDFTIVAEMYSDDALKSSVEAGVGLAIVPSIIVSREVQRGWISTVQLEGSVNVVPFQLVYRKERFKSKAALEFVDFLCTHREEIFC